MVQIRCLVFLFGALVLAPTLAAQQTPPAAAPADTTEGAGVVSPRGAFIRSLILPGWGQSVVGAPGRGGVYFALESTSLWMLYRTQQRLSAARSEERFLRENRLLGPQEQFALVNAREEQRQDWLVLSVFWLFFAGADAFVAAHLRDFDQRVVLAPEPGGALRLQATVPLVRRR